MKMPLAPSRRYVFALFTTLLVLPWLNVERAGAAINYSVAPNGSLDIDPLTTILPAGTDRMEVLLTTVPGVSHGTIYKLDPFSVPDVIPWGDPTFGPGGTIDRIVGTRGFRYVNDGTGAGTSESIPVNFRDATGFTNVADTIVISINGAFVAPQITTEPDALIQIAPGGTATMTVAGTGTPAPTYQWYSGVVGDTTFPISGATDATYTTPALITVAQYPYWVRLTNGGGTADSTGVTVQVATPTTVTTSDVTTQYKTFTRTVTANATVSPALNVGKVRFTILSFASFNDSATLVNGLTGDTAVSIPAGIVVGDYNMEAHFFGPSGYADSFDNKTLHILRADTTTTAASQTIDASLSDQAVTLTSAVTSDAGLVEEGTVTFTVLNGATVVGTAVTSSTVVDGGAAVSYTIPANTPAGVYTVQAFYNRGPDYNYSNDTSHTLTVAPVVTANTAVISADTTTLTIAGIGFDASTANDSIAFNGGASGNVTGATATQLSIGSLAGLVGGALNATVTVNGASNTTPVQVATVTPVVTAATTALAVNAGTMTIDGFGFDPTASNNAVTLTGSAAGNVTTTTKTQLSITGLSGLTLGVLNATVTTNTQISGDPVQVATVIPVITPNTANLSAVATTMTINGFGFDPIASSNTVTFAGGVTGDVNGATANQLTLTNLAGLTPGPLLASVTVDGLASGNAVQVATVNAVPVAQPSSVTTLEDTPLSFAVADFGYTDLENDALASITISSLNLASGDTLKLNGTPVNAGDTIAALQIPNLVYASAPNANGAARSSFNFKVNDGGNGTVAAVMTINVTPVNDPPVVAVNTGLTIINGAGATIGNTLLQATDVDGDMPTFTLLTAPTHGTLLKNGVALIAGGSFIQGDIDANLLTYAAGATLGSDSFSFSLSDGNGGLVPATTFNITVTETPSLVVTTTSDVVDNADGLTSLREAINQANSDGVDSTITFATPLFSSVQTITLGGTALPNITTNTTINGPGASLLTISGNNASRIFSIGAATVAINGLTLANGNVTSGSNAQGGAIITQGALTLSNCKLSNNAVNGTISGLGGAIFVAGGTTDLTGCTLASNAAHGILADSQGGAVYVSGGTVRVTNSTLSGNSATGAYGSNIGGAIYADGGTLSLTNATISGNGVSGGPASEGGGIAAATAAVSLVNCTVAGNSAAGGSIVSGAGGLFIGAASVNCGNSIFAGNAGGDIGGAINSLGHNLIGDSSGATINGVTTGNVLNQSPVLDVLANNGGPVQSVALLYGSPAIEGGDNSLIPVGITTDGRGAGFARIQGATVDIGAYELQHYTLSGLVRTGALVAVSGVNVTATALAGGTPVTVQTNASGAYSISDVVPGLYTVAAAKTGYTMAPASQGLRVSNANRAANFVATATAASYTLSGRISTTSGQALASLSVTLTATPAGVVSPVLTNSAGYYTFNKVPNGSYTITPTLAGYSFSPSPTRGITVNGANLSGLNFVRTGHKISGRISTSRGIAIVGATVTLDGTTTAVSNSAGYYTFTNVGDGDHTLTPTLAGKTFAPVSRTSVTVAGADLSGLNFIGS